MTKSSFSQSQSNLDPNQNNQSQSSVHPPNSFPSKSEYPPNTSNFPPQQSYYSQEQRKYPPHQNSIPSGNNFPPSKTKKPPDKKYYRKEDPDNINLTNIYLSLNNTDINPSTNDTEKYNSFGEFTNNNLYNSSNLFPLSFNKSIRKNSLKRNKLKIPTVDELFDLANNEGEKEAIIDDELHSDDEIVFQPKVKQNKKIILNYLPKIKNQVPKISLSLIEIINTDISPEQKIQVNNEIENKKEDIIDLKEEKEKEEDNEKEIELNKENISGKKTPYKESSYLSKIKQLGSMSKLSLCNKIQKYTEICQQVLKEQENGEEVIQESGEKQKKGRKKNNG